MRLHLTLITLALLAAGCTTEEPTTPAATDDTDTAVDPWPEASDPPASSDPAHPTTPTTVPTPAPTAPPANTTVVADEPAPPQPIPWTLNTTVALGYDIGAGAGTAQEESPQPVPTNGVTSPEHCADATFTVPAEATSLVLVITGAPAATGDPAAPSPGAGMFALKITAPDGSVSYVEAPTPSGADPVVVTWSAPAATLGAWALHAYPMGPAAQQTWDVAVTVAGSSISPPVALAAGTTC